MKADMLVFYGKESGPVEMLCHQFETVSRRSKHDLALIMKNQVASAGGPVVEQSPPKSATGCSARERGRPVHQE